MNKSKAQERDIPRATEILEPENRPLTARQASRLAKAAGLVAEAVHGRTIKELSNEFRWRIDPELLPTRKICGQVVKLDPVTGLEHPVPGATVYAEDTDCSYMGFFPAGSSWHWLYPFHCHREVIGVAKTDACGRFCVRVPRFDIDWVLRWRLERHCYLKLLRRPSLQDLLEHLGDIVVGPEWPPHPDPDPGPLRIDEGLLQRMERLAGPKAAQTLRTVQMGRMFGEDTTKLQRVLEAPAFASAMPPPLPTSGKHLDLKTLVVESGMPAERAKALSRLTPGAFIGPFLRCEWELTREWTPILDVPDITFRVTQDVDGDGAEETIYSEGHFQVRWNETAIPPVKIHASSTAIASPILADPDHCLPGVGVPEGSPAISLAGLYPLHNVVGLEEYVIESPASEGYALRPNPPRLDGSPFSAPHRPASAPFAGTLQLYGNNLGVPEATHYRVAYTFRPTNPEDGPALPSFTPIKDCPPWSLWRTNDTVTPAVFETISVSPDVQGWYSILPAPATESLRWLPAHLLLNWPAATPGIYTLKLQFAKLGAGGAKVLLATESATVTLQIDNLPPTALLQSINWRIKRIPEDPWQNLSADCGNIKRSPGETVQLRVGYTASARHLRDMCIYGTGCGGHYLVPTPATAPAPQAFGEFHGAVSPATFLRHWHTDPADNTISRSDLFEIPASYKQGAYGISLWVNSRAFSPAGADGGFELNWLYDNPSPIYRYANWAFALIDA